MREIEERIKGMKKDDMFRDEEEYDEDTFEEMEDDDIDDDDTFSIKLTDIDGD